MFGRHMIPEDWWGQTSAPCGSTVWGRSGERRSEHHKTDGVSKCSLYDSDYVCIGLYGWEAVVELLTIQETAQMLRVTPITVRRFIADGRLPAVKVGKGVRVRRGAVDGLVAPVTPQTRQARKRAPAGHPLTYEHPLWKLVGSATDAPPTDASKKHEYLAEALAPKQL